MAAGVFYDGDSLVDELDIGGPVGAVVADAEQVSTSLSVRNHIRLRFPQPLPWASLSVVAAALMKGLLIGLAIGGAATACVLCAGRRIPPERDEAEAKEPA